MRNKRCITLKREAWTAPESFPFGDALLKPLAGGEELAWCVI
jgi:dihydroorotase